MWLEFKLAYNNVTLLHISQYTKELSPYFDCIIELIYFAYFKLFWYNVSVFIIF